MRFCKSPFVVIIVALTLLVGIPVVAQMSGSRGGVTAPTTITKVGDLTAESAQSYITVDGVVELRVQPTEIRIVLALTSEAETSSDCRKTIDAQIAALKPGWTAIGIPESHIVEDFISVLPRYEIAIESLKGEEVAIEKKVGYLMQSNIHLAVKNDAEAMKALGVAFENGVTDIIGFDYWSSALNELKNKALAQAIQVAKEKSDALLGGLFDARPPIINIQEKTDVYYPESMYESFDNTASAEYRSSFNSRRNLPEIRMYRPKNTYYRGLYPNADLQSNALPMKSEISVVSTVRLYFEAPSAKDYHASKRKD